MPLRSRVARIAGGIALLAVLLGGWRLWRGAARADALAATPSRNPVGVAGTLLAKNSIGRSGAYYLPSRHASTRVPLMVAIHGTGGSGMSMVARLRDVAEREQFIVVAPDSRMAPNGQFSWQVPSQPNDTSDDTAHIRACLDEVLRMPGVQVDADRTLIIGHSGGASTAPYEASVDPFYKAFAVLHGGIFAGGLGSNRVRGWFSTGAMDTIRSPLSVRTAAGDAQRSGMGPVEYREFAGGHDLGEEELMQLVRWWLGA